MVEHGQHGGVADPRGCQQEWAVARGQDQVSERCRHGERVAGLCVFVEPRRDLAVRPRLVVDALDADTPILPTGCGGEAVLADLPGPVRESDLDADVLARSEGGSRAPVGGPQEEETTSDVSWRRSAISMRCQTSPSAVPASWYRRASMAISALAMSQ